MRQDQLRRIAEELLCPFFSGARLVGGVPSTAREQLVLRRGERSGRTAEQIVRSFVEVMGEIEPAFSTAFEADVLRTLPAKVVARTVGGDRHESMLATLDWMEAWADCHYEGLPVAGSQGFDPHARGGNIDLDELSSLEFAAVLSDAVDTLILVDPRGACCGPSVFGYAGGAVVFRTLFPGCACCVGGRWPGGLGAQRDGRDTGRQSQPVAFRQTLGLLALSYA